MKSYRGALIKDTLINTFFVFVLVTIVGMFSNVILLALGYMMSLPMSQNGYNDTNTQLLWFTLASVSLIACMLAVCGLTQLVGSSAAQLQVSYQLERKLHVPSLAVSVIGGNLLHALLCVFLSWASLAYLIIAGPVQYIARFIGKGEMSIFNDIALDFSHGIVIGAIAIYSICLTAASFIGYVLGHRKKIRAVLEKEAEAEREKKRPAEAWSREDAEKAADLETYVKEDKKIVRDKLDRRTEEAFVLLNRKRVIATAAFIVIWSAAVLLFAAYWIPHTGREILSPYSAPFPVLLMLPFWPFRLHRRFIGKPGYAVVIKAEIGHRTKARATSRGRYGGMSTVAVGVLMLRIESGESITVDISPEAVRYYESGEKVYRMPAYKYPVKCTYDYEEDVFCPSCGNYSKVGRKRCPKCFTPHVRTR